MLGIKIALLRKASGLSQAALAAQIHVSPSTIGNYEQGRRVPSCQVLLALSKTFDVSVEYFLSPDEFLIAPESNLPELLLHSGIAQRMKDKRRNCPLSREEVAVLLAALMTM